MVTPEQSSQIQKQDAPCGSVTPLPQDGTQREQTPSKALDTRTRGAPAESANDLADREDAARISRIVSFRYEHEIEDWIAKEEGIDRPAGPG